MAAAFADVPEAITNTVDIAAAATSSSSSATSSRCTRCPTDETLESALRARPRGAASTARLNARRTLDSDRRRRGGATSERLDLRARRDHADGLRRLLPDRRRLHQLGEGAGHPGRARAAARRPAAWSPGRSASPTSIRIAHDLLFERFLNPERKSMPDIDVDFCFERRDEVIRYVREKYGADRVAQIITFGTLKGKQAIKDVGRVLDFTFAETDRIAKLYPGAEAGQGLPARARRSRWSRACAELRDSGEREGQLFDLRAAARRACCATPPSTPPASSSPPQPLIDDLPLCVDKDGAVVTQYTVRRRRGDRPDQVRLPRPEDADADRRASCAASATGAASTIDLEPRCRSTTSRPTSCSPTATRSASSRSSRGGMRKLLTQLQPDAASRT